MQGNLPPVEDYGLVGDTRTSALISSAGSIDWMCFPRPDSEPVFGALVAGERGGSFSIGVEDARVESRRYLDRSAVIETVHRSGPAAVTVIDGMVLDVRSELLPQAVLVRELSCVGGSASVRILFDPRAGWSGSPLQGDRRYGALIVRHPRVVLALVTSPDLELRPRKELRVTLRDGDRLRLVVGFTERQPAVIVDPTTASERIRDAATWWRSWSEDLDVGSIQSDAVLRSLITLRLLTHAPSGAPVAAPTTSLPEVPGGEANWDYRLAWVRDASLGTGAFVGCGKRDEARAFLGWMLHAGRLTRPRLHVAYDVLGRVRTTKERILPGLPGYDGARPVRVGNAAVEQFQLDAYGWMIDAGWSLARTGEELASETRRSIFGHADLLARKWREADHGIWEIRGAPRHYVFSKAMAWVGLDRALRLADRLGVRPSRARRWSTEGDRIVDEVGERGFDERRASYVQAYESDVLDASALLLVASGIEPANSPRIGSTADAVRRELGAGGPLVYRYPPNGEGAFLACSFWLSQALVAAGRRDEAAELFSSTCDVATPLGLFGEEMEPRGRRHLGNFPQALTHAALVHAAMALRSDRVTDEGTRPGSRRRARARRGR